MKHCHISLPSIFDIDSHRLQALNKHHLTNDEHLIPYISSYKCHAGYVSGSVPRLVCSYGDSFHVAVYGRIWVWFVRNINWIVIPNRCSSVSTVLHLCHYDLLLCATVLTEDDQTIFYYLAWYLKASTDASLIELFSPRFYDLCTTVNLSTL